MLEVDPNTVPWPIRFAGTWTIFLVLAVDYPIISPLAVVLVAPIFGLILETFPGGAFYFLWGEAMTDNPTNPTKQDHWTALDQKVFEKAKEVDWEIKCFRSYCEGMRKGWWFGFAWGVTILVTIVALGIFAWNLVDLVL